LAEAGHPSLVTTVSPFQRFNDSTIQRIPGTPTRHAEALCEGWLASAEALYERRIKREVNVILKWVQYFNESRSEWSDWGERHGR